MTVESSWAWPLPPFMEVDLQYSDLHKNVLYNGQFDSIIKKTKADMSYLDYILSLEGFEGEKKLSAISDAIVRRFPKTTLNGREFKYQYNKRFNLTIKALSDEFVDNFCAKIDNVVSKESGVKLCCQMAFGGGAYRAKGSDMVGNTTITSIPLRDVVFDFSFDLFYKPGYEQTAIDLQQEMQDIVDKHFHNDSHERRSFAFTFGDTNISNPDIRKMYYDNEEQYKKLQKLKERVDPDDIFHTDLTVQLPQYPEYKEKKI